MATLFPTSIQTFTTREDDPAETPGPYSILAEHMNTPQDTLAAIQAKVGVDDSADETSLDYLIKAAEDPGHTHTAYLGATGPATMTANSASPVLTLNQQGAGYGLLIQDNGTEKLRYDAETGSLVFMGGVSEGISFIQNSPSSYMVIKKGGGNLIGLEVQANFYTGFIVPQGASASVMGSQLHLLKGLRLRGTGDNGWGDHLVFDQNYELTTIAAAVNSDTTIQIPANSFVLAVTGRVNTQPGGTSTFDIGVAGDTTRFGTGISTAVGTQFQLPGSFVKYAAATSVRVTPDTTPSDAAGRIRISFTYVTMVAPTS